MADFNGVQTAAFSLYPEQIDAIAIYAESLRDGNQAPPNVSLALRRMVNHFMSCQFPLLGIAEPASIEAPQ